MQVLVPASSKHAQDAASAVPAHWQHVVPLFTTRHITYQSNCIPHQLTLGTHLSAEVLIPDSEPTRT